MFGIITALEHEYAAVRTILLEPKDIQYPGGGAGRRFTIGSVKSIHDNGAHKVALALLPSMGNNIASALATLMIEHFRSEKLEAIIMVGIAGGVPDPERPDNHVRLGDIVVCNEGGVIQYDNKKLELALKTQKIKELLRFPPRPPSAKLLQALNIFKTGELQRNRPWLDHIQVGQRILRGFERPSTDKDILIDYDGNVIIHPIDSNRVENEPRVHLGKIGSANILLKNPKLRDFLRDEYQIKANEMEGSGIADATWISGDGYFVIRGICDYCDSKKNSDWQKYAALVAAAYTKGLLESIPTDIAPDFYVKDSAEVVREKSKYLPIEHNKYLSSFFVGRNVEIGRIIDRLASNESKIALVANGGIGKTTLAATVAERLREHSLSTERYVFLADLKNETPSDAALRWLKYFGLNYDSENESTRLNKIISILSNTPSIVILDNCQEKNATQKLVIHSPHVFSILTTRMKKSVPVEFALEPIDILDLTSSMELIKHFIGKQRFDEDINSVTRICELCKGVPYALKIAGAELRNAVRWKNLDKYVKKLEENALEALSPADDTGEGVRANLDISYANLKGREAVILDSLGIFSGNEFFAEAVSAMHGFNVIAILELLDDRTLIKEYGNQRFGLHDFTLQYAREQYLVSQSREIWSNRLIQFYASFLAPRRSSYAEIDIERNNILGLVLNNFPQNPNVNSYFELIKNLHPYLKDRGLWNELLEISRHAFQLFDDQPAKKAFIATWLLSWVYFQQNQFEQAIKIAQAGLALYEDVSDLSGKAAAKRRLGMSLMELKRFADAERWLLEAKEEFKSLKNSLKVADTLCLLGLLERKKEPPNPGTASKYLEEALTLASGDEKETGLILYGLGRLNAVIGNYQAALEYHISSLEIDEHLGRQPGIAYNKFRIGEIEIINLASRDNAIEKLESSVKIFAKLGNLKRIKQIESIITNNG